VSNVVGPVKSLNSNQFFFVPFSFGFVLFKMFFIYKNKTLIRVDSIMSAAKCFIKQISDLIGQELNIKI